MKIKYLLNSHLVSFLEATYSGRGNEAKGFQSFIDSPFEGEDFNTIIEVLKNLLFLDGIEGLYILLLILIICFKYLYKFNIKLLNKLVLLIPNKYLPNKLKNGISNVDKAVEFNSKFYDTMFIIVLILLLLTKLLHFYYSSELYSNIDDYILVYNYIKKSNLLLLVIPLLNNKFKFKGLTKTPIPYPHKGKGRSFYHYLPFLPLHHGASGPRVRPDSWRFINKFIISVPFTLHPIPARGRTRYWKGVKGEGDRGSGYQGVM